MTVYILFGVALLAIILGKIYGRNLSSMPSGSTTSLFRSLFTGGTGDSGTQKSVLGFDVALVVGGWLLFNFILFMVIPEAMDAWRKTTPLFFFGTEVAALVMLLGILPWERKLIPLKVLWVLIAVTVAFGFRGQFFNKPPLDAGPSSATAQSQMEFWVIADSPSCVTIPTGDSILAAVEKGGNLKVVYPDGEVMRIGPNQRAPVRSFEAGSRICLLLDDGEKVPVKMRLKS